MTVPIYASWAACAGSVARCLAATAPTLADGMFGTVGEAGGFPETGWFRMHPSDARGYVFIGPHGGDHHYQAAPPPELDPAAIPAAPAIPRGRLLREADAFLADARTLAGGAAIAINGGRVVIPPDPDAVAAASGVLNRLGPARALADPAAVSTILREAALSFLRDLPGGASAALAASTAAAGERRAGCGAHGPLWALAQVRAAGGAALLAQAPASPVLFKLFDPFGRGADPEPALAMAVDDLVGAGLAETLVTALDTLLARAEAARDRALDSRGVVAHGTALYEAAGDAWAAMRLAELLRNGPEASRPAFLDGYAASAEEIVVRATHALVVDCVNLGSGTALQRHRALIAEGGPAKADELIETFWFYPRALRETLITVP